MPANTSIGSPVRIIKNICANCNPNKARYPRNPKLATCSLNLSCPSGGLKFLITGKRYIISARK